MRLIKIADSFYAYPYGISQDLWEVKANTVQPMAEPILTQAQMSEVYAQLIRYSKLRWVSANVTSFQQAFEFLEVKAEVARKTISFWDAYQIREILSQGEEDSLISKITQLPSNSSIISNSSGSWTVNGITSTYYPGDIFVKDYYNRITRIPMISTGFYFPRSIIKNDSGSSSSTYTLTYQYASSAPESGSSSTGTSIEPKETMSFVVEPASNESGYNTSFTLNSSTTYKDITKITVNSVALYPIVKAYLSGELIFDAVTVTTSGSKWRITKKTNVPSIQVTVR